MKLLFKVIGFIFIIFATSAIGFLKANSLNLRCKKLSKIYSCIADLKERIRLHQGEITILLNQSFGQFPLNYTHLLPDDIILLEDFFKNIGMSDTKTEYERCELYMSLLSHKTDEAKKEYSELNKLYKSMGFLSGLFICIFLL